MSYPEIASLHSITLSACAKSLVGSVTPIASAVRLLITSSNVVGCSIGNSLAGVPRKSFCTYVASCR